MRLDRFHIRKYRSIEDSGEIKVDENITTFVGINESGKTNIMRALKKINNIKDQNFDDLTEDPAWYFNQHDPNEVFVDAIFKLTKEEKEEIQKMGNTNPPDEIKFSRAKNMDLICHFKVKQKSISFDTINTDHLNPIRVVIEQINTTFDGGDLHKQNLTTLFDTIVNEFKKEFNTCPPESLKKIKTGIEDIDKVISQIPDDKLDKPKLNTLLEKIYEVIEDNEDQIKEYLRERLPRFIYVDNVSIIDSRIHIPTFIQKMDGDNLTNQDRAAKTLLDLGGLDIHELYELSKEEGQREEIRKNKDRLDKKLGLASKKVSEEIDKIWTSNEHSIEFSVNGEDLRVWVINKKDGVKLELEERSRGYQWYFSFYTVFNVESEQRHKDAIILLDEPALFLHVKGQEDFLNKTLPILSKKNQIIYTTHSPSMVNLTKPETIHTVTIKEKNISGTKQKTSHISGDVWDNDKDALFPLQSALHYTMAQSMFIGRKNLIVEGITDFWFLTGGSSLLESAGKIHLKKDFVIVPVGGAKKSVLFATTYKSQNLDTAVLLDADHEGQSTSELIVKTKVLREKKISLINEIFNKSENMSIEDIFPQEYYLKFVKSTYKKELNEKGIEDIVLNSQKPMIVERIGDFFKENDLGEFHKSRPARAILTELGKSDIDSFPAELIKKFEMIFNKINSMIEGN